jgi:hypothetical protein
MYLTMSCLLDILTKQQVDKKMQKRTFKSAIKLATLSVI